MSANNRRMSRDSLGPTPSESSGEQKQEIDFLQNRDLYFTTLDKLQKSAKKVRFEDTKREQTLMEYLPVNERFSLNKEGKVLARWQERQRDWVKIQTNINKKIGHLDSKPLMMATADEFRARNEEYDLIQAALPLEDQYADTWQLLLRGGGPVKVPVGHLFSGLECVYELKAPKPKMIRKPKPVKFTGKNDNFLEQSDALILKRTKNEKSIRSIRPHDLSYEAASNLVLRSVDLMKWAKDSSNAYFKEQKENNLSVIDEEESIYSKKSSLAEMEENEKGPKVDFITTKEIVFESKKGENVFNSVKFKNTGKVTVSYKWKKMVALPKESEVASPSKSSQLSITMPSSIGSTLNEVITNKGSDNGILRSHILVANRDSFFCLESSGVVLPQETIDTKFVFSNRAGGGVYNETWLIEFVPSDSLLIYKTDPTETNDYFENRSSCTGVLSVTLRGLCYTPDASINKRQFVKTHIDKKTVESMVFDEINFCLRRVRDPVRPRNLKERQIGMFKSINSNILESRSSRFTSMTPLFIIPERLDLFCQLYAKATITFEKVIRHLNSVRAELRNEDVGSFNYSDSPFYLSDAKVNEIRDKLFPEKLIEIFDEITEDMLISTWDFNLTTIIDGLTELLPRVSEIEEIEESLRLRQIALEKERARVERKAARLAAGNDSDEEEEEEEEEEPDDEIVIKPKHPLYIETDSILMEVENLVNYLFTRPIQNDVISDAIKTWIDGMLDCFEDTKIESLKAAELYDLSVSGNLALPLIQSPFVSEEGLTAWNNIMKQISLADTSGAPPPKGGKAPAAKKGAVTGPTPIQIDFYYNQFYNKILTKFLDVATNSFASIDSAFYEIAQSDLKSYPFANDSNFNIAALRTDDVKTEDTGNSIVFVNFNGDSFTNPTQFSACGAQDNNKKDSLKPIFKLIDFDVKAIVLVYEPDINLDVDIVKPLSIIPSLDEIKTILYKKRAEFIIREEKYTKLMRRKDKKFINNKKFRELDLIPCSSYGELKLMLNNLTSKGFIRNEDSNYLAEFIPIIVVENIIKKDVVPEEPPFEEVVSDDDEAPINIGKSEKRNKMISDWYRKRPHKVNVSISTDNELIVSTDCFCDGYAAVSEAYKIVNNNSQELCRWLEANPIKLFNVDKLSSFQNMNEKFKIADRILSEEVREAFLWTGILQLMPTMDKYLAEFAQLQTTTEDGDVIERSYSLIDNLASLFPHSLTNLTLKPSAFVVLAGSVRIDKFRVLDQLIDFADAIYIAGEMSIPFVGLSSSVILSKYGKLCSTFKKACCNLIFKARLRGCKLVFPVDFLQGDEEIKVGDRLKSFTTAQSDARNEGVDYEGEVKIVSVSDSESQNTITVPGYIYDIGPESLNSLKSFVSSADLLYVWGTVGYCEVSSFQTGQQTLVNVANQLIVNTEGRKQERNPLNTLLFGESSVEWFTRLIDTDGEMNGDLISPGIVKYSNRSSDNFCGLVGQYSSNVIKGSTLKLREPIESEWIYSKVVIETEEDDDDDDEEEDEED